MNQLQDLLKFVQLTLDFQQVRRRIIVKGEERNENDVEHSFQLALTAWYLVEKDKLPLRKDLVLKYGLIHDLVEVYAGDTYLFEPDETIKNTKVQREHEAAEKLKLEFPEFPGLHAAIQAYEKRADKESQFVYALDKILPMINIFLDEGRTWKKEGITLQQLIEAKTDKVVISKEITDYFNQLAATIKEREKDLFNSNV